MAYSVARRIGPATANSRRRNGHGSAASPRFSVRFVSVGASTPGSPSWSRRIQRACHDARPVRKHAGALQPDTSPSRLHTWTAHTISAPAGSGRPAYGMPSDSPEATRPESHSVPCPARTSASPSAATTR